MDGWKNAHLDAQHVEEHVVRDVVGGVELVRVAVQDGLARRGLWVGLWVVGRGYTNGYKITKKAAAGAARKAPHPFA